MAVPGIQAPSRRSSIRNRAPRPAGDHSTAAVHRSGATAGADLLLHALRHADGDGLHLLNRNAAANRLGVGVRDRPLAADVFRDLLLLGDATGLANRALNLLLHSLVAAHLHGAGLANLGLLAHRNRIAFGDLAGHPLLDGLGLRAAVVGARIAAIALVHPFEKTGSARNFADLVVALVHASGAPRGQWLCRAACVTDSLCVSAG